MEYLGRAVVYVMALVTIIVVPGCASMVNRRVATATLPMAATYPPLLSHIKQDGHCYILKAKNPDENVSQKVILVTSPRSHTIVGKAYISWSMEGTILSLEIGAQDISVLRALQQQCLTRRSGGKGSWNSVLGFRPFPVAPPAPDAAHWMTLSVLLEGWPFYETCWAQDYAGESPLELVVDGKAVQWKKVESEYLQQLSTARAQVVLRQTIRW